MKILVLESDPKQLYKKFINDFPDSVHWQKFYPSGNPDNCDPCPMSDPDIVICVGAVGFVTFEDLDAMGITSKPVRIHANLGNRDIGVMFRKNDERVIDNNNYIISYNPDHWNVQDPVKRKFIKQKLTALPLPFLVSDIPDVVVNYNSRDISHTQSLGVTGGVYSKQTIVMQNILKEKNMKLKRIFNKPWSEAIEMKKSCSVNYDNFGGIYGVTSLESMSMGIPTICYVESNTLTYYENLFETNIPIISPVSLDWNERYDQMEVIIDKISGGVFDLEAIGMASKNFMKNYTIKTKAMYLNYFNSLGG